MAKKRRRIRSPHPGVLLLKRTLPSGNETWFVRFKDPETGRTKNQALASLGLSTHEARRQWAIQKSKSLAARRAEVESGAPRKTRTTLDEAIKKFLDSCEVRLRPNTLATYRAGIDRFATWVKSSQISYVEDLNPAKLHEFHAWLVAGRRQAAARGSKRGTRIPTTAAPSPTSINIHLTSVKVLLNEWRRMDLLPRLNRDLISDSLKRQRVPRNPPKYLSASDCRGLLEAALRHDRDTYKGTREEYAGIRPLGSTPRHIGIAPFVAFMLLTGCRRGEALALKWEDIDLDALDQNGNKVGEIELLAEATKTNIERRIGLEVSPSLHKLLAVMELQSENEGYVFGGSTPFTVDLIESTRGRLINTYGAPRFDWQILRQTCATFLVNSSGIFGGASVFLAARRLGHSVTIAEKHYWGLAPGIPREARTLEAAMQIEELTQQVVEAAGVTGSKSNGAKVA